MKKTICLDFDGVVHRYSQGWKDGSIYDGVTPGFFDWYLRVRDRFRLVIHSSRMTNETDIHKVRVWLQTQWNAFCFEKSYSQSPLEIEYALFKPPAFLSIDDRALTFKGDWDCPEFTAESMEKFKSWTN